ncbi:tyrosine-type recombinase/integrase [[Actinomadura] parvosata]|uniref:tyrosine-type recombinase/integrase n=1 Tax=[Actinomadura] parvosata TaxID=1955412 RepID=UPI00406CED72
MLLPPGTGPQAAGPGGGQATGRCTAALAGRWTDPERAKVKLAEYSATWIDQRPGLRPRTIDLYRRLLKKHITPYLGNVLPGELSTAMIRHWRADLLGKGVSVSMAAKAYRLLRAVLMTAAEDDRIISRNPCRIRGARVRSACVWPTWNAPRASWSLVRPSLRPGSISSASPQAIIPALREHLRLYVKPEAGSLVFTTGIKGGPMRRSGFNKLSGWIEAVRVIRVPGLHFHDLRHTENMIAADSGAGLKDRMARMGHDNVRAAMIYQHAVRGADKLITEAIDKHLIGHDRARDDDDEDPPGLLVPTA